MELLPDGSSHDRGLSPSALPPLSSPTSGEAVLDGEAASPFPLPCCVPLLQLAMPERQEEAKRSLAALGFAPTPDQWKMILAPTPATCVIAGAGSGKSTTLVLRLLVLHKLLGIPLEEMHVFSFTRASTKDFRRKVAEKILQWEAVIEQRSMTDQRRAEVEALARRTVSTFHSVISRLKQYVLPAGSSSRQFFDLLRDPSSGGEDEGSYNPFVNTKLSHAQVQLLNAAHTLAYQRFPRYRELVVFLLQEQERRIWARAANVAERDDRLEQWKWEQLLRQEQVYHGFDSEGHYAPTPGYPDQKGFQYVDPYRAAVADRLRAWGVSFSTLSLFPIRCPIPGGFPGELYAAFRIGERLFVHVERYRPRERRWGAIERGLSFHERDRRRFIALYSGSIDQHKILGPEDFALVGTRALLTAHGDFKLQQWLTLSGYVAHTDSAPSVRIQLPGDVHRGHIAEVLYQEGVFIESLGLEVDQLEGQAWPLDSTSRAVAEALPLFWQAFREQLISHRLVRFHDVLRLLRKEQTLHRQRSVLQSLQHIFIDEFQDISPEIVDWLARTVRTHVKNGVECSVTAIGDDYQSIYGWRGSHPIFLMHFERYFPTQTVGHLVLVDNFRSRQPIIDAAEAVLEAVRWKVPKHGQSKFREGEHLGLEPVRLVDIPLSWNGNSRETDLWQTFCVYVSALLRDLEGADLLSQMSEGRRMLSVFILARTHLTLSAIPARGTLRRSLLQGLRARGVKQFQDVDLRQGTFHSSKGLEADVVLLLDDAFPPEEHPLRSWVFGQLAFPGGEAGTYTQTMSDETYRLGYVALTRARLAAMWVPSVGEMAPDEDNEQKITRGNRQREVSISSQGCFAVVKRHLHLRS